MSHERDPTMDMSHFPMVPHAPIAPIYVQRRGNSNPFSGIEIRDQHVIAHQRARLTTAQRNPKRKIASCPLRLPRRSRRQGCSLSGGVVRVARLSYSVPMRSGPRTPFFALRLGAQVRRTDGSGQYPIGFRTRTCKLVATGVDPDHPVAIGSPKPITDLVLCARPPIVFP